MSSGENGSASAPAQQIANLSLPAGGKQAWTQIMQGTATVPNEISAGSPIVMAWARFDDGTQVAGGVCKSDTPADYNIKFMWAFDARGNRYPGYPIDVSDDEDFLARSYEFTLTPDAAQSYRLDVIEGS
jgi:hypothetical protein